MPESEQRLLMLIGNEPAQCRSITALAAREGWRTLVIREPSSAVAVLTRREDADAGAVCMDLAVAGDEACVIIAELRSRHPNTPIFVLADDVPGEPPIEALRAGATNFLVKPVAVEPLVEALRAAGLRESWGDELAQLTYKPAAPPLFEAMIGSATNFRRALTVAAKAARGRDPVLIEGEPGTGKEHLVRAMHAAGSRANVPLRIINAACTPNNAIESALFGHEKDAFPGAFEQRPGAIQLSEGGTIVIDEIERLTLPMQVRLLDFLRRGSVRPVGGHHGVRVDVRLIAISNRSLRDRVLPGMFDPGLLEAITATTVAMPALRDRAGDIPDLVRHFLAQIGEWPGLRKLGITEAALALLSGYDWPGNVRQLHSALFRASVFSEGDRLAPGDFPSLSTKLGADAGAVQATAPPMGSAGIMLYTQDGNLRPLDEIEGDVIRLAIGLYRGRMTEVARRLGIGRSTLYRKLSELGIDNAA